MFTALETKFAALNTREKILTVFAVIALLWAAWDGFFYTPFKQKQKLLTQEISRLTTQRATQQIKPAATVANVDPNKVKQQQLVKLKADYTEQQGKIMLTDKKFVSPTLMAKVLSDVLVQNSRISLIRLETLPVTPLLSLSGTLKAKGQKTIYQHGLLLTFSGDYLSTLMYLKVLEGLPWHFLWDSIDYAVKTYPLAEVSLRIYTLSFEEHWLEV